MEPSNSTPTTVGIESVETTTLNLFLHKYKSITIGYIVLIAASVVACLYVRNVVPLLCVVIIGAAMYALERLKVQSLFMQQFGASLGFAYSATGEIGRGALFQLGYDQSAQNVLSGMYKGRPTRVYAYQYTEGNGRSAHTYYFTVFETTFNAQMPDVRLISRTAQNFSSLSGNGEALNLEGNFNTYFIVEVSKDFELEAYQILTPDVMARLIDMAKDLCFEFSGDRLSIFAPTQITVRADLQKMFDLAEYLDTLVAKNVEEIRVEAAH